MRPESLSLFKIEKDERILSQLAHPSGDLAYARLVLDDLRATGVTSLAVESNKLVMLGKGFRSIVVECLSEKYGTVAAKIIRSDFAVKETEREAALQRAANEVGVGPKLYANRGVVLVMELIRGEDLTEWLLKLPEGNEGVIRGIVKELLNQCFLLDSVNINHYELSDATRHVIKTEKGVVIIDFGKARFSSKVSNLTSIFNYLFRSKIASIIERSGLRYPSIELLRTYKRRPTREVFEEVLKEVFAVK